MPTSKNSTGVHGPQTVSWIFPIKFIPYHALQPGNRIFHPTANHFRSLQTRKVPCRLRPASLISYYVLFPFSHIYAIINTVSATGSFICTSSKPKSALM